MENTKFYLKRVISTSGRNLTSVECIKISPAGRNDTCVFVILHLTVTEPLSITNTKNIEQYALPLLIQPYIISDATPQIIPEHL